MRGKTALLLLAGASFCWADLITPLKLAGMADDPWKAFSPFAHKITDPAPQSPGEYTGVFYSGSFSGARGYVDGNGQDPDNVSFEQEHAGFSAMGQRVTATNLPPSTNPSVCLSPFNCAYYGAAQTGIRSNKAKAHVLSDWEQGNTFSGAWADVQYSNSSSLWTEGFIFDALPGLNGGSTTLEVNLDGSWSGTGGFYYELGALYLDRGGYNPDFEDYPAVAIATGSYTPGIPLVRLFGVTRPPSDGESGPPPVPETEGGSSIDRKLNFTFDWLPGERILVYSLLSTGASRFAGEAAFESTALVTGFGITGGTIGQQLSDFDWSNLGQGGDSDPDPGAPVPEPSGVLLIGGGLLAVACFSRKHA